MQYISTRGQAEPKNFAQLLLSGAASDGGLYVPETWPQLDAAAIAGFAEKPFHEVAYAILKLFAGGAIPDDVLKQACQQAYASFDHPDVCPLVQLTPHFYLLELFHGPTYAFKDIAMQLIARLIEHELQQKDRKAAIICATSGDTGAAAVSAFQGSKAAKVVVLFPHNRISEAQRKQITASGAPNVISIAIEGSFDDAQAIVKQLFADQEFSQGCNLTSVNSINWARIAAQAAYYFTAALKVAAPKRPMTFCVPTGNFGDIFAGYAAKKIGLSLARLIIATNRNDILARALASGVYQIEPVAATTSPSMDIQVSSNFERLLFETSGRNADLVRGLMDSLRKEERFKISPQVLETMRGIFAAASASEMEVMAKIRDVHQRTGRFVDPHTSVALVAAEKAGKASETTIALATAHAAKFSDTVRDACGAAPPMPARLAAQLKKGESYITLPPEAAKVRSYLQRNL